MSMIDGCANIGPDRLDLLFCERPAPRRHLAFAVEHRIDKTCAILRPQTPEVVCPSAVLQTFTMTAHAMAVVDRHAGRDLLLIDNLRRRRLKERKGNQGRESSSHCDRSLRQEAAGGRPRVLMMFSPRTA